MALQAKRSSIKRAALLKYCCPLLLFFTYFKLVHSGEIYRSTRNCLLGQTYLQIWFFFLFFCCTFQAARNELASWRRDLVGLVVVRVPDLV